MAGEAKEKLPLKLKLKAWWEGYDRDEYAAIRADEAESNDVKGQGAPTSTPGSAPTKGKNAVDDLPFDPWDEERIDIAQYIWGDGFCGPGGAEHIVSMSKLLALSPEMSMVILGGGLGGPARSL